MSELKIKIVRLHQSIKVDNKQDNIFRDEQFEMQRRDGQIFFMAKGADASKEFLTSTEVTNVAYTMYYLPKKAPKA